MDKIQPFLFSSLYGWKSESRSFKKISSKVTVGHYTSLKPSNNTHLDELDFGVCLSLSASAQTNSQKIYVKFGDGVKPFKIQLVQELMPKDLHITRNNGFLI